MTAWFYRKAYWQDQVSVDTSLCERNLGCMEGCTGGPLEKYLQEDAEPMM